MRNSVNELILKAKGDSIIVVGGTGVLDDSHRKVWNGMLLEFCARFQLLVMGTMFKLKSHFKNSWQHIRSKRWHQIDHVSVIKKTENSSV